MDANWAAEIRTLEPRTLLSAAVAGRDVGTQDEFFVPTITLDSNLETIDENSDTSSRTFMTGFLITSTNPGVISTSLSGFDADFFELDGDQLFLKAGVVLNFESQPTYDVTVNVDDSLFPGDPDNIANFVLLLNDVNEAPVMANQTFTVLAGAANGTVVGTIAASDPDDGQSLTFGAFFESNPGVFAVNANTGVITVANSAALTNGLSATLGVDVTDDGLPPMSNFADMTINVVNNTAPTIGGTAANQAVNDNATINPFSGVTITDPDPQTISTVVTIVNGVNRGDFTAVSATGWTRQEIVNDIRYTRDLANAAAAQTAVRALVFDPRENALAPTATEGTAVILAVTDGVVPVTNNTTSVITTSVNDLLTIGGTAANQAVNDNATINPFNLVTVSDPDTQALTANVTISNGVNRGDFTPGSTGGWTRTTPVGGNIVYARTFAAAANNGAVVQAAIRALVFDPRENAIKPNTTETTPFTITIFGGGPAPTANSTTSVVTTSINNAPAFSGIQNRSVNDNATVNPFNDLEVIDPDFQEGLAKVTILNGVVRGDFINAVQTGWNRTVLGNDIKYERYFNPSADIGSTVMNAFRGLVFQPRQNAIKPGTTELTDFQVIFSDGVAQPIVNAATRVTTVSVNNAPTITGAVPNLPVFDNATATPFVAEATSLTITDPDNQDMFATVTINNGVVRGDFTVASRAGWTRAVNGNNIVYTRYFAQSANIGNVVQTAVRALVFQPRVNVLTPGTTETTAFTVTVKDGSNASVTNAGTSVVTTSANDAPVIGGTVAGQTMNDNQTKLVFNTVTITDADTDDMLVRVTIPNGVNRGDFAPASTVGWTRTVNGNDIKYERYFNTATNIGAVVQTAIRALNFQPRTNVPIGTTETTGFTIFVNDGFANATNSVTSVITTGVAPRPAAAEFVEADIATVVVPTVKKVTTNGLTRLLKKPR